MSTIFDESWKLSPAEDATIDGVIGDECYNVATCGDPVEVPEERDFRNARAIAALPEIVRALAGLVGFIDLIRHRDDLSPDFRAVLDDNHRIVTARCVLAAVEEKAAEAVATEERQQERLDNGQFGVGA